MAASDTPLQTPIVPAPRQQKAVAARPAVSNLMAGTGTTGRFSAQTRLQARLIHGPDCKVRFVNFAHHVHNVHSPAALSDVAMDRCNAATALLSNTPAEKVPTPAPARP